MSNSIQIKKGKPIIIQKDSDILRNIYNYKVKASELELFDQYAQEHARITGTPCDYYKLDIKNSKLDPLYGEPIEGGEVYSKAFKIFAHILWPNPNLRVQEAGVSMEFSSVIWVSRKEMDDKGIPSPFAGDIIRFWDIPYFNKLSVTNQDIEGSGMYFDVIDVKDDGHIKDTPFFVGFKLQVKRTSKFEAERKLNPGTEGREC